MAIMVDDDHNENANKLQPYSRVSLVHLHNNYKEYERDRKFNDSIFVNFL